MKKSLKFCIFGLAAVMMVSGCSKKADSSSDTTTAETTAANESQAVNVPLVLDEALATALKEGTWVTKIGNYAGVTYTPLSTEVTDEDVEAQITAFVASHPTITEVDREAKEGDIVNIDYVGKKDGVAFDGGTASGYDLTLGSGQFIDGFEDGLIGVKKGDTRNLDLTFPENYGNQDLAGAAVVFEVTVNAVKESSESELNDELVAANTDFATVDEFRTGLRSRMEQSAQDDAQQQKKADVFLKVVDDSEVTVPEEYIQYMYDLQRASSEQQAQMYGMDLETMIGLYGMDMETFENQLRVSAEEGCKQNAVVNAIARAEMITVEDGDLETLAEDFGYENKEAMIEQAGEDTVNNYILTEKVVDFIVEKAVEEQ